MRSRNSAAKAASILYPTVSSRLLPLTLLCLLVGGAIGVAEETAPARVQVYWNQSRTVAVAGASHVTVLHDSICRAQVLTDQVQFFGLARGETLVFVWTKEQRLTLLVRVIEEPAKRLPPRLRVGNESSTRGYIGSSLQSNSGSESQATYVLFHRFSWQQDINGNHLSVQGMGQDSTVPGAPRFNLNTGSVQYSTPRGTLSLLDSIVNVSGGFRGQIVPFSASNSVLLRGADIDLKRGANEFEFFAGATLPAFFLNFSGTRDLAGFNFNRVQSPRLYLYSTTAVADVPFLKLASGFERHTSAFQTIGLTSHLNKQWAVQAMVGASTMGMMAQGAIAYTAQKRSGFVSITNSSANFPLNQLQLLPAGRSSVTAGANLQLASWLATTVFYQHTSTQSSALFTQPGSSDYFNPSLNFVLSQHNRFTFSYALTRSEGGLKLGNQSTAHRESFALYSQLRDPLSNSIQLNLGSLSDPFRLNSRSQFSIHETMNLRIKSRNSLFASVSHERTNPSLESRLNREVGLLSPALRQLFLLNPVAFIESSNLAPELRALLSNLQPSNTQLTFGGQLLIGSRLNLSPNVGYFHTAENVRENSNSHLLGYTMTYQLTRGLELQSSLTNLFVLDSARQGVRRNTVFTVGFNKSMSGAPRWLLPAHGNRGAVRGRVFRDLNVNGQFNTGEPGMSGLRVELSTGQTVVTDAEGRFEFSGLAPDAFDVTLPLLQFKEPVRVTGSTSVRVDLSSRRYAEVNFGVVNFSRVMGNVYDDYLLSGKRQPDALGLRGIKLVLISGSVSRAGVTDTGGDFEFDDLSPGDYQLLLDRSTIPANFVGPTEPFAIHVGPTATVTQEIALQALRSLAGKVLLKAEDRNGAKEPQIVNVVDRKNGNGNPNHGDQNGRGNRRNGKIGQGEKLEQPLAQVAAVKLQPLGRVQLAVDRNVVTTDADGNFVLRNLPAGELTLTIPPAVPVPPGVKLPSFTIQMPREPVQLQGATILISNPDLVKYLRGPSTD